ncbi:ELM1/GtrOC1 family putative glycosyltransferase [Congregibacter brevis]|uniref:ELM1/GtrOC1 family putative glycosyltransferase n=1 Tax=Congregibacter brevis TaxID=3081201 RepID=A0ABZ0IF60_9GAMM|nr:ELM1/GtrOC1 family putative glycosyltransferase [Congregibacter sp. IMCC45268]
MGTVAGAQAPQTIGILSDGKPGHLNQSLGLADALQRLRPNLRVQEIPAMPRSQVFVEFLRPKKREPDVDLLIAAGHATHLSLLALRRAYSCPAIVLMRPSLPGAFFDLRIEPRHDGGREAPRCWISEGPLNRMHPSGIRTESGLILVGGPSPHYSWDDAAVVQQVKALCDGRRQWQLSGSRRTPTSLMTALSNLDVSGLTVHDSSSLPSTWLANELPKAKECWVSPDSASMVYEALTAGCAVGVLDLPAVDGSRVARSIDGLLEQQRLISFEAFTEGALPTTPVEPFAEADRCARRILEQGWL